MKSKLFLAIALIAAVLFAFLWIQEKRKAQNNYLTPETYSSLDKIKKSNLRDIVINEYLDQERKLYKDDTEPFEKPVADNWVDTFKTSTFYDCLNNKEGIYHDLDKLLYYFQAWQKMKVTRVDFRFAKYPSTWPFPKLRGQFDLIIYPQISNIDMIPIPGNNATLPLNLGDLHP